MKCIYHCDLDGRCAGAIVAFFTGNREEENYIEANYNDVLPIDDFTNGEKVFLVDFSFTENTKHYLDKLIAKDCNIIHIDHHSSTMELYKNNPKYQELDGIRTEEHSGAALTWMYFTGAKSIEECPFFVQYVSDFDCWHFNLHNTQEFKYGMETFDYHPLCKIWEQLISEHYDCDDNLSFVHSIIDNGFVVKKYIDNINKEYCEKYAYETELEGNKCIVVNKKDCGSLVFGELVEQYPMCMVWSFDGEYYQYSIYSSNENIACNKIAEKYGGGGHKGAAGFRMKEMPFTKI